MRIFRFALLLVLTLASNQVLGSQCTGVRIDYAIPIIDDDPSLPSVNSPLSLQFEEQRIGQRLFAMDDNEDPGIQAIASYYKLAKAGDFKAVFRYLTEGTVENVEQAKFIAQSYLNNGHLDNPTLVTRICLDEQVYYVFKSDKNPRMTFGLMYHPHANKLSYTYADPLVTILLRVFGESVEGTFPSKQGYPVETSFLQEGIKIAGIRQLSKAGDERLNAFFDMYKNAVEQARNGDSTRYVELLSSASAERFSFELAGSTSINSVLPSKLTKMLISSNDQIDLIFYSDNYLAQPLENGINQSDLSTYSELNIRPRVLTIRRKDELLIAEHISTFSDQLISSEEFFQDVILPALVSTNGN